MQFVKEFHTGAEKNSKKAKSPLPRRRNGKNMPYIHNMTIIGDINIDGTTIDQATSNKYLRQKTQQTSNRTAAEGKRCYIFKPVNCLSLKL